MARNIEIKARIKDVDALRAHAEALSDVPVQVLSQVDTFFFVPQGRLKLRVMVPDCGQLVFYQREDAVGPRRSDYFIASTSDPAAMQVVLATALGVRGVVRKQRQLFQVGATRVHVDEVEGLGFFLELEVVLSSGQSDAEGEATAADLMAKLGVDPSDLVKVAYIDLLEGRAG